ncbi:Multidrug resistance-associated protein 4 [Stylophora pistillata]|uniref:Multidrug resistance-associated protein 4 n=1 Tax=Stylophora pistillata TaxID=50429 RepID=A0A2B4RRI1_STYPI|nr:Multidrug resistance-associated protein 4 [Stylophora pistillata]
MTRHGYHKIFQVDEKAPQNASFVSYVLFQWMNSVFETGKQRALEQSDFLPLSEENRTSFLTEKLQECWRKEERKCHETRGRPKLWKSVIRTISFREQMILIYMGFYRSFFRIPSPLLLGYLLSALMFSEPQKILLYGCALALFFSALMERVTAQMLMYRCELLGITLSSALKGLVYHKTLLLSKDALFQYTTGKVIDLVSNDIQRLEGEAIKWIFLGFISLIELLIVPFLMVYFIGWQSLVGVLFLYLLLPYYLLLSRGGAVLRLRTAAVSDQRLSLMNQVVSGIRSLKIHAWEDEYRQQIRSTRRKEISIIRKMCAVRAGVLALRFSSISIATLLSVITLLLTEETLTPVNVFMLISFNNMLVICICSYLGFALLEGYEAYASLGRIEEFLLLKNLRVNSSDCSSRKETESEAENPSEKKRNSDCHKKLRDVSTTNELQDQTILRVRSLAYKQTERQDSYILQGIEFCALASSLTVITGPVGCGKTTLLSVIAGEVSCTHGQVSCQGTLVFVPQTAWVFSGTIRDNIFFGLSYEESKYTRVIEACALTDDIQQLPDTDQTGVGERGVVLSGGQRARVSLARAVYADADVYVLDDPLSAVDFKVGQHIFEKCVKELLGDKTRMMTSHHEDHMKDADEVIVLCKGRVLEKGSFLELQDKGILNNTIDPLYKKISKGSSGEEFTIEKEIGNLEAAGNLIGTENPSKEIRSLLMPQEDREIGVISSKLYWNYFRSGMDTWMIVAIILFIIIVQAFAGLALAYVVQKFGPAQIAVRRTAEVENFMTSVERVITYAKLEFEPGYRIEQRPPENWPSKGNIIFKDVSLTYYPGGPQVLKKIKVNFKGGTKVGIAGRTGAGKSSFVAALMRMPESFGEIIIDGIPIKEINLQETRRRISVLGQSPVLFSGSLRKNLDLTEQFTDADLWQVLKDVQLKEFVKSLHGQLDHKLLENGANISVGERHLICLARVLLQRNKIIVLDEPTANVDPETEETIWGVVRQKLRDSTVITIAHRLKTIKDCDKFLVLKHGMVAEFDKWDSLVNTEGSE